MTLEGIDTTTFDYTLDLAGPEGNVQLLWNPHLSSLRWAESGDAVSLTPIGKQYDAQAFGIANEVSPENPGRKHDITVLKISMGLRCNRACVYCNQSLHAGSVGHRLEEVHHFLDNLNKVFSGGPKGDGTDCRIEFWGGEPLLYWKHLQVLAGTLRSLYPKAHLNVISNGDLLSEEVLEFFDKVDINLGLSHDGPAMALRGDDPLEDPERLAMWQRAWEVLGTRGNLGFNAVLTRDNLSLGAVRQHIESRLGLEPFTIPLSTEEILLPYDEDAHLCVPYTKAEHQNATATVFYEAVAGETVPGCSSVLNKMEDLFSAIATSRPSYSLMQKCGMDRPDQLAIDLQGNMTTCQNTSYDGEDGRHIIGRDFDLDGARLHTAHHMLTRDECRNCPVVQLCKGSCMFLEGENWRTACDVSFTYNVGLLAAALFYLTGGYTLTTISGRMIRRPEIGDTVDVIDVQSLMQRFADFGTSEQREQLGVAA